MYLCISHICTDWELVVHQIISCYETWNQQTIADVFRSTYHIANFKAMLFATYKQLDRKPLLEAQNLS